MWIATCLGHHHLDKLLVVNLPVAVDVRLSDHLVNLLVSQLLAKVGHHVTQLEQTRPERQSLAAAL
jgi:hypothetical protein